MSSKRWIHSRSMADRTTKLREILVTDTMYVSDENISDFRKRGYKVTRLALHDPTETELMEALRGKVGYILGGIEKVSRRTIEKVSRRTIENADDLRAIVYASSNWQDYIPAYAEVTRRGIAIANCPGGDRQFALDANSTIIPAHLPRSSGLWIPYNQSSRVINYSGFDGIYNETFQFRGTQNDYVLKPGSTGIMTFEIEAISTEQQGRSYPIPLPKALNLTNYAIFYHEITSLEDLSKYPGVTFGDNGHGGFNACSKGPAGAGSCIGGSSDGANSVEAFVTDHPGVDVLFEPPSEVLPLSTNVTSQVVTMTITTDGDAPRGTYLVLLPGIGLDSFLLTVGNQPYHE